MLSMMYRMLSGEPPPPGQQRWGVEPRRDDVTDGHAVLGQQVADLAQFSVQILMHMCGGRSTPRTCHSRCPGRGSWDRRRGVAVNNERLREFHGRRLGDDDGRRRTE